ncbi:PapC/FimD family outer membrane usher protein [Serratia sp. S1B]|nr:PapC/FimD family outer membrane usher protein [Serratia sp. S1B]
MIKIKYLVINITIFVFFLSSQDRAYAIEFNTDVLDTSDRENIDFSRFSQKGYVLPGSYPLQIQLNKQAITPGSISIQFIERDKNGEQPEKESQTALPQPCLSAEIVEKMGLTEVALKKVTYWHQGECADFSALKGFELSTNMADSLLLLNMPQIWLEYSDQSWLPPSRWEEGIPALLLDYNINANSTKNKSETNRENVSYNGTTGANIGSWRLRADYQGNYSSNYRGNQGVGNENTFDWSRFYAYRSLPQLRAMLMLGENYLSSDIFSTWLYTGASLTSDDRMLPPKLRGYAPQVSGIADTNARVIISQQGRVLYDSTVPAGPFAIQDLDSSVRGRLDVEIIEQTGQKKTFTVDTAYVPYLTRPGQVRYKLFGGRSRVNNHELEGPAFLSGEASWGISNSWSLYGGGIEAGQYHAIALGLGRDMNLWGTLSADVTQSVASLPDHGNNQGKSWRFSYSKYFDEANTDITFAGYRFSEKGYLTMQQYLDNRYRDNSFGQEKEQYTITLNKNFESVQTSVNLQYSYQTFWDQGVSNYYSVNINRYFEIFGFKNVSLGMSASRTKYQNSNNNALFLRLSMPLGSGYINYSGSKNDDRYTQTVGYSSTVNGGLDSYNVNVGVNSGAEQNTQSQFSGYYTHSSPLVSVAGNMAYVEDSYISAGINLTGGATVTTKGAALHSGGINGGTRLLVDTDGIAGVPIDGSRVKTNHWGIGVVSDISSYQRNLTSVDLDKLPDNMEAKRTTVESVLTEGAVGYRKFEVLKGIRLFAVLRRSDNSYPPFSASVINSAGRELGMVSEDGLAWLSGITGGETLNVAWDNQQRCQVTIPNDIVEGKQLLLPCRDIITIPAE